MVVRVSDNQAFDFVLVHDLNGTADGVIRQACDIRMYIDQVLAAVEKSSLPKSQEELMSWAQWARVQADDLDPIVSGSFQIDELPTESDRIPDSSVVPE